jgi:response regulator RpfG family c-di-GMP phosphodiesterase
MADQSKPRVLCVDDEPRVLEGIALGLRRRYEVETATSGAAGLEILARDPSIAVVMSDMRMPGMDGAAFLKRAVDVAPDAVRILLTGQAELASAITAVNEGRIFRFLTKPCPPAVLLPAFEASVEQHRLIVSEKVLLEQTLRGCVKALSDVLALTSPAAFGRGNRIARLVTEMATTLALAERWSVEVAAMFSQLGFVTLPDELAARIHHGQDLTAEEADQVNKLPYVAERILAGIPRLDVVRKILTACVRPVRRLATGADEKSVFLMQASQMLRIAIDYDDLLARGNAPAMAVATMRGREAYNAAVLDALAATAAAGTAVDEVHELPLSGLREGMIVADDLQMTSGTLLVARGYEITAGFVERAKNFGPNTVKGPVRVIVRHVPAAGVEPTPPAPAVPVVPI